jgi:hypothetical protein
MEIEGIRGLTVRHPGPYRFRLADGSVVDVASQEYLLLPGPSLRDAPTIVVYGPDPRNFQLLDVLMIVAAEPVNGPSVRTATDPH